MSVVEHVMHPVLTCAQNATSIGSIGKLLWGLASAFVSDVFRSFAISCVLHTARIAMRVLIIGSGNAGQTLAEKLCRETGRVVVCTGGFHIDNMKPEQIDEVVKALDGLADEIVSGIAGAGYSPLSTGF